jgi:hypothetical protein
MGRGKKAKPWSRSAAKKRSAIGIDDQWAEGLSDRLIGACSPKQRDAALDPHRRVSILCGRGAGKTTVMRARALRKMAKKHRARIIYIALSRPTARDLNWEPLKELINKLGETENFEFSESSYTATCKRTGSTYRMVGAEDKKEIEKLRGQPFDEVQIDESASFDPEILTWLIDRIVGPRLGEREGCILLGGSPGHILRGPFYDATRRGSPQHRPYADRKKPEHKGWMGWSSHAWSLRYIVELPNAKKLYPAQIKLWAEALIEKANKQWSDKNPIWRREYEGEWAADNTENVFQYTAHLQDGDERGPAGTVWNQWDPFAGETLEGMLALKAAIAALPKDLGMFHFAVANDKGHSDPFACNVFAYAPADIKRRIWHVFCFEKTKLHAKPIAQLLIGADAVERMLTGKPVDPYGGVFGLTGWPDGIVWDADQAHIDELGNVYGILATKAEKKQDYKLGAIELVNGDLYDGRILVIKDSPLEIQLLGLQWATNENGRLKENTAQANHSSDCLVYGRRLIATLFENGTAGSAPTAANANNYVDPQGLGIPEESPRGEFDSLVSDGTYVDLFGNG